MAETSVPITAGSGTSIDGYSLTDGKIQQAVVLGDGTNNAYKATVFPGGYLRVSDEPIQLFYDPFDAAPDTTNVWTTSNAGGGVAAAVTAGQLALGTGTTTAGTSSIVSIPTFRPTIPAWIGYSFAINIPDLAAPTAQTYRFWGAGSAAGTTTSGPTDGVGFELTTGGKMIAVVYAAGARTAVQDLSSATGNSKQPTDTASHRYGVYIRTDKSFWFIDTLDNIVATSSFQAPTIQTLPVKLLAVAGTTPGSSGVINCVGLAVWDTGKNGVSISDGTYPWRKTKIDASGSQFVRPPSSTTPTVSAVAGTVTNSTTILALNLNRLGVLITNDSTSILYLAYGATCTPTSFSVKIAAGGYYEVPPNFNYTGILTGVWATANGNARVTELTP